MKKFNLTDAAALLLWLLPIAYLIFIYGSLPVTVPMHYDSSGTPNSFGSRSQFMVMQLFLTGVSLGTYLLLRYLPVIDPKKKAQYSEDTIVKLALGLTLFMTAINIGIAYAAVHKGFKIDKMLFPALGLLFAFLGNMMNNIKPNYFVGIRTPWTLEDEATWKATHRMAARFWLIGGVLITAACLVTDSQTISRFFPGAVILIAFVPIIYSYIYYKKHQAA